MGAPTCDGYAMQERVGLVQVCDRDTRVARYMFVKTVGWMITLTIGGNMTPSTTSRPKYTKEEIPPDQEGLMYAGKPLI